MPTFDDKDHLFTPQEIEFLAEDEEVTILPNFTFDTDRSTLIGWGGRRYGPFRPNAAVNVPLWMAIALTRRNRCDILRPPWLELPKLEEYFEMEKADPTSFQPLPRYYIEIAHLLFQYSKSTFKDELRKTKDLVDDLIKRRMHKLESGMAAVTGPVTVKLNNLSHMELNAIRPFFQLALERFHEYSQLDTQTNLDREVGTLTPSSQVVAQPIQRVLRRD